MPLPAYAMYEPPPPGASADVVADGVARAWRAMAANVASAMHSHDSRDVRTGTLGDARIPLSMQGRSFTTTCVFGQNIRPLNDGTSDIGVAGARWRDARLSRDLIVGGTIVVGTDPGGTRAVRIGGNVTVGSGNTYAVNDVQVVAARDTGWTAMTGTANKGTAYDTATVTLAQLAGRVMSLQAALTTHGLLGA